MACSSCTELKPIPAEFTTLNLGTVATDTAHIIYFKNLATGFESAYPVTSTGTALIISVADDGLKVVPGEWYEIRATLASATDITTNVTITISATGYTCFEAQFVNVYATSTKTQNSFTAITTKVA